MKPTGFITITAIAAATLAAGAFAQQGDMAARMGKPVTRAEVTAKVKEQFARVDANRDGKATKEEFMAAREARRGAMQKARFEKLDTNKNGELSQAEMDAGRDMMRSKMEERRAQMGGKMGEGAGPRMMGRPGMRRGMGAGLGPGKGERFAKIDTDGNGGVTEAEMLSAALARFDASDTNKDGTVTREERRAAMMKMRAERRGS